ncbi:hypothetical protein D3C75_1021320 [compost metagenome]
MTTTNPIVRQGYRIQIGHTAFQNAYRFALHLKSQLVRLLVPPLQASLLTDNSNLLPVHRTTVNRRAPQGANGTIVILHQHIGIVLQRRPRFDKTLAAAHQAFDL